MKHNQRKPPGYCRRGETSLVYGDVEYMMTKVSFFQEIEELNGRYRLQIVRKLRLASNMQQGYPVLHDSTAVFAQQSDDRG